MKLRNKALFLDRDGVINIDKGYVGAQADFVFLDGIFPFLSAASDKGYRLVIVTNQAGVARGYYTQTAYEDLTRWILARFAEKGICIAAALACFTHPDGQAGLLKRESFWRKPNPGMILEAAQNLSLDLGHSALLGDSLRDVQAAQAAGVAKPLWLRGAATRAPQGVRCVSDFTQALADL